MTVLLVQNVVDLSDWILLARGRVPLLIQPYNI